MAGDRVLVTGARGFIAKQVIAELLRDGYSVRGTIRDAKAEAEVRAAVGGAVGNRAQFPDALSFATADLLADAGWAEAAAGCRYVIHLASPFPAVQPKDSAAIVRPAVDGTRRVLAAAKAAGVGRVVLTSSVVAVVSGRFDKELFDESDWSDTTFPRITPYQLSKTLAERAAWNFAREADLPLAVLNPAQVFGPPLDANLDTSGYIIASQLRGRFPAVANYGFPIVDVRDVATAHVAALTNREALGQRIILADEFTWLIEIARWLGEAFPAYRSKVPRRVLPNFVARLATPFVPELGTLRADLGRPWPVTHAKAERIFGMRFRPAREAVIAMAEALIALRAVP
ncbi:MAG: NAD-dependent epimerase/dehydratase family protein [Bauldia sp.]